MHSSTKWENSAVLSFVFGTVAFYLPYPYAMVFNDLPCFFFFPQFLFSVLAVALGHRGWIRTREHSELKEKALAIVGLALGYTTVAFWVVRVVISQSTSFTSIIT